MYSVRRSHRNYKADVDKSFGYDYFYNKACPKFKNDKIIPLIKYVLLTLREILRLSVRNEMAKKPRRIDLLLFSS